MDFELETVITIMISLVAVIVAFWQANISKQQLEGAKTTKDETQKLLDEIKDKIIKIENTSNETRLDVKEQITKLIDNQNEHLKTLLQAPKENNQNEMMMRLLAPLLEKPDILKTIVELGHNLGKNN